MAITTYSELQTAVANWLDRSDLTSRIPEFIELAEARFNRVVRAPDMLTRDDSFSVTGQYVALPTDFLELKRAYLKTSPPTPLEYLTPEQMQEKRQLLDDIGKPIYITVSGGNFEFLKTPDQTYTASILFYDAIDGLATTDPNWLLTSHPDIYLFGALLEAAPYLVEDERIPMWQSRLDSALHELERHNQSKAVIGTPVARAKPLG